MKDEEEPLESGGQLLHPSSLILHPSATPSLTVGLPPRTELPVACSLTEVELRERRAVLLERAGRAVLETKELEDGFAYRFPEGDEWLAELAEIIRLERRCCPFLGFGLSVGPGGGPVWLELTGPPGTKEFLAALFA